MTLKIIEGKILETEKYDWIKGTGKFIDSSTLKVSNKELTAENIVLANGARPIIPDIKGLDKLEYITNRNVFNLNQLPKSMIFVGGGYISVEFAHFFSAFGTEVTLLGRNPYLVKKEDKDVSELLKKELSKRMNVITNIEAQSVSKKGSTYILVAKERESNTKQYFEAESLFIATGRRPNSDLLNIKNAGIKVEKNGFVQVDEYLRTSKEGIWALGDINGKNMYRHVANDEARIVYNNIKRIENKEELLKMDYSAIPYAVFSQPQIATVGMTLEKAVETSRKLLVGKRDYVDVFKGIALGHPKGFCRIIVDEQTKKILGSTIIGPYAPILLQSIVNVMNCNEGTYMPLIKAVYVHPEITELIRSTIGALQPYQSTKIARMP
jgi:dihydrolipoamide dehydrogenase